MCSTPLGSPTGLQKQLFATVRLAAGCTRVGVPGWVYGWGIRVGIPGEYPATLLEEVPSTAKRAPEAHSVGWSGWYWGPGVPVLGTAAGTVLVPPCGPGRPPVGSLYQDLTDCRLTANKGEISGHFL